MPVVINIPLEQDVLLNLPVEEDPDQEAMVQIRQATQREVEMRASFGKVTRVYKVTGDQEISSDISYESQKRYESWLVLSGCNLVVPGDKENEYKPAFRFKKMNDGKTRVNMTLEQFTEVWGILPQHWADAVHKAVLKVNPQWDPNFRSVEE